MQWLKYLKERFIMQSLGDIYLPIDPEKSTDGHHVVADGPLRCCQRERKGGTLRRVLSVGLAAATIVLLVFMAYSQLNKICALKGIQATTRGDKEASTPVASQLDTLVPTRAGIFDDDDDDDKPDPKSGWKYGLYLQQCSGNGPRVGGGTGGGTSACLTPHSGWTYGFDSYNVTVYREPDSSGGAAYYVCTYKKSDCTAPVTKYPVLATTDCTYGWAYSMKIISKTLGAPPKKPIWPWPPKKPLKPC